ncbi:photosynthetic reaction center subunit H [Piscinibacter sakaiensis]|uniref:Photosynthetic reaction center, H subunit n=1 Tax=Piscinibacter sakaiensis TaxID=1547922 RepID=A0A0K8NVG2_PISS1|nr:photosynthetic reaction center subunit H [Piscinibacter sakaiensis]GAP34382.1 photosynthetic reaction center, H subunit [Piscinibacter sakaiensis]
MSTGAITPYIDVAQLVLYAFWIFFAGLLIYLHRENKREGYPLESDRSNSRVAVQGWPAVPEPKTYRLRDGRSVSVPRAEAPVPVTGARPVGPWPGAPLQPDGDALASGVGPGSIAPRADVPDTTFEGTDRLVPLRLDPAWGVAHEDTDPRGLDVEGADGRVAGRVVDAWVDRAEALLRYLEVELAGGAGRVLLPMNFARIDRRRVRVASLLGEQIARVPRTRDADRVTLLEEEKVMAFYGAGTLYATAQRQEPLL